MRSVQDSFSLNGFGGPELSSRTPDNLDEHVCQVKDLNPLPGRRCVDEAAVEPAGVG